VLRHVKESYRRQASVLLNQGGRNQPGVAVYHRPLSSDHRVTKIIAQPSPLKRVVSTNSHTSTTRTDRKKWLPPQRRKEQGRRKPCRDGKSTISSA
jgi:hypothetical protein